MTTEMKIIDIKTLPDLINYYGAHDKDGGGRLSSDEVSAFTLSRYDFSRDGVLSPWEVMTAANRIQGRSIFRRRDIMHLRSSHGSPFPLAIQLTKDTPLRGITYKRGMVLIGRYGRVAFGVLAAATAIGGRTFPAGTKVFFRDDGSLRAVRTPTDTRLTRGKQVIVAKANTLTLFHGEGRLIKSVTLATSTRITTAAKTFTFKAGTRLSFDDKDENDFDEWNTLTAAIARLNTSSVPAQVDALDLIDRVAVAAMNIYAWRDFKRYARKTIATNSRLPRKLFFALLKTMNTVTRCITPAEEMRDRIMRIGLKQYPRRTLTFIAQHYSHLGANHRAYITRTLLGHPDTRTRHAALKLMILMEDMREDKIRFLANRLRAETAPTILASIVRALIALTPYPYVRSLLPRIRKLAARAPADSALAYAAAQFMGTVKVIREWKKERLARRRARIAKRRADERRALEKRLLGGRVSGGIAGGLMLRVGRHVLTGGCAASLHGTLIKDLWLSKDNRYVLSTGIEAALDPVMAHWRAGWYSLGIRTGLRLNLSRIDATGNERWRIFAGPGYTMRYTPALDTDRLSHGVSIDMGMLFSDTPTPSENGSSLMMGPAVRVTHFPERGETSLTVGMKFSWQRTRR